MRRARGGGTTYLDGNKLMGGFPSGAGSDGRVGFLGELAGFHIPKPCCVVFDGPPPAAARGAETQMQGFRVLFAANRSADSVILERVRPGDSVVTSDFALAGSCRAAGARVIGGREFLGSLRPRREPRTEKPSAVSAEEVAELLRHFGDGDSS